VTVTGTVHAGRRDLALLASRLLAVEVDGPLLARLRGAPELLDPAVAAIDDPQAIEELAVEYCRLFIGPQPSCPPYASAHLGGRRLGGRPEREFLAFLEVHGLELHGRPDLMLLGADHLAVQLTVLAHLHDRLGADPADGAAAEALHELHARHLDPWAAAAAGVLAAQARVRPYSLLGPIVRDLLRP